MHSVVPRGCGEIVCGHARGSADAVDEHIDCSELARTKDQEKQGQLKRLAAFHDVHKADSGAALAKLKQVAINGWNVFAELMKTVKVASLGQSTDALFEVGAQYRRSM